MLNSSKNPPINICGLINNDNAYERVKILKFHNFDYLTTIKLI